MEHNVIGWIEIPVSDMDRAITFYTALGFELTKMELGPLDMAMFPWKEGAFGAGCALVKNEHYVPSADGTLVYFTTPSGDLDKDAAAVAKAGGTVLVPKKKIDDEHGYMMVLKDTEGNRVALHAMR